MICAFSPSERTNAHKSPMVCSRRGSASNTAGNWPIQVLAVAARQESVFRKAQNRAGERTGSVRTGVVLAHLTRWHTWPRLRPLLSGGQSLYVRDSQGEHISSWFLRGIFITLDDFDISPRQPKYTRRSFQMRIFTLLGITWKTKCPAFIKSQVNCDEPQFLERWVQFPRPRLGQITGIFVQSRNDLSDKVN